MGVYRAILKRRTIRRFQERAVPFRILQKCVNAARLSPCARNVQELEFIAVNDKMQVEKILSAVSFGGVVKKHGMKKGEEPGAFIVIISEKANSGNYTACNAGIAAEAITLTAIEEGLGSCIIGAIERNRLAVLLDIPETFEIRLVVALGYPKESPKVEEAYGKNTAYWVDEKMQLHVPKRSLEDVLHKNRF